MPNIKDRLNALRRQNAPSFVPESRRRQPKVEEIAPPDIRELVADSLHLDKILRLTTEQAAINHDIRELNKARKPLVEQIKSLCNIYGLRKAQVDACRLAYFPVQKSAIKKELLLAAGVSPKIIAACTVTTESWNLKITEAGESEEED